MIIGSRRPCQALGKRFARNFRRIAKVTRRKRRRRTIRETNARDAHWPHAADQASVDETVGGCSPRVCSA